MSKRYSPHEKAAALHSLEMNGGSIPHTSQQTGIPTRTLSAWRRELWEQQLQQLQQLQLSSPPPVQQQQTALEIPEDITDQETLTHVRQQILNQVRAIAPMLTTGLELVPPYQRILAITQLLENLKRLDNFVPHEATIKVEFHNPDGTISSVPYWQRDRDEE